MSLLASTVARSFVKFAELKFDTNTKCNVRPGAFALNIDWEKILHFMLKFLPSEKLGSCGILKLLSRKIIRPNSRVVFHVCSP